MLKCAAQQLSVQCWNPIRNSFVGGDMHTEEVETFKHGTDVRKEILKVRIRKDLTVDYEVANVRFSAGDEVEWHTEGGSITIDFDPNNHPFKDHSFKVEPGKPTRSGVPHGGVGYYDYYIRSEAMQMSADPGVNVQP